MSKFKPGDRVKYISSAFLSSYGPIYPGKEFTVKCIRRQLSGDALEMRETEDYTWNCSSFELVDESKFHKHHDLIIAWAKGAKIEGRTSPQNKWRDVDTPTWNENYEYRIKPEPKPDVVVTASAKMMPDVLVYNKPIFALKLVDDEGNIKLTFDGETGKLKAVELI